MNVKELQSAIGTTPDGQFGKASGAALNRAFTSVKAPAVTDGEIAAFADRLGVTAKQLRAVAKVESSGGGFDNLGRPKILYERHIFHRLTAGKWSPSSFSQERGGGYSEGSWDKLALACGRDPDAAFSACSWGKFQVMGMHFARLGYTSPFLMAHSATQSEAAHYEMLCRYVERFGLVDEMRAISNHADDCRAFAKGYNGPAYEKFDYHVKLAGAMQ